MLRYAILALCLGCNFAVAQTFPPPFTGIPPGTAIPTDATIGGSPVASQAMLPQPCVAIPPSDTLNGNVGASTCFSHGDSTKVSNVQRANVTTASDGTWSVTWARSFISASPVVSANPVNPTASVPYTCNITSSNATAATGKCWQGNGITVSLLGQTVLPYTAVAASIGLKVIGSEPTQ